MLGWRLLLLRLVVVQLDGQGHRPPLQTHQENLNLAAGFDLVLPPHGVVGKDGPARAARQRSGYWRAQMACTETPSHRAKGTEQNKTSTFISTLDF